jgi:hypothetical protein
MNFQGPRAVGLLPNYQVTWKEPLQHFVEFLLCKGTSVETWNERQMIVIKTKGCTLGRIIPQWDKRQFADSRRGGGQGCRVILHGYWYATTFARSGQEQRSDHGNGGLESS